MKRTGFKVFILIFLLTAFICGCSNKSAWKDKLNNISKQNKYALLFIDDGNSKESAPLLENFKKNVKQLSGQFEIIEVDYNKEKDSLLKFLNTNSIGKFPIIISIAPNGAITKVFTQQCNSEELSGSIVTEKQGEMILSLQKGNAVFLCIYKGQPGELTRVKTELKTIETNFNGYASVYYLDTGDSKETSFIKTLPSVNSDIAVFTIVPPGNITGKLEGNKINVKNLIQGLQSSCGSGGCGSGGCK